ncbi:OLC1v1020351C1 [Oldenlandia corymbosa var. corymbosa]|uniref:OLC1v1020351C1 n=1 Tax=Oldenlandia corymbosa var. corymbosa TaxID=529605 RepID=A0AAV1EG65_OLDCO|nr:OLC1v1020351C1 [Oldenlandia corymbosa var. corymbosa]
MYGGSSDGEGHDVAGGTARKIPPASSMLWVRNLRRFIGSGAGLGSEALMELETKRILLDIFKEKQQKSAEAGTIPSFYKKKPEEGSISHRVQRLAKYRFLKKQSDLLLNADDLDAMWVCLRENCVIDDATGAEKMNYEDFCHIASVCTEQIGPKCRRFFSPSNFMKFEKDESGRIAILPFYLYVMRTVSLTQARIDMSELDEDSDGFLQPHEMEAYIRGLIPNLAQLRDMPTAFVQMYCRIAAHKFFFFCDPNRRGKACIKKVLLSNCLQELMELHQESEEEVTDTEQAENWFSLTSAQRICDMFLALDKDMNGTLSKQELREYADGTLTDIFIERVFDEHVRRGKLGGGNSREMDFESFLDFVLALENKDTPEGLTYLFRCLDLHGKGFLTTADIHTLFRDVHHKWIEGGNYELCIEDVRDEIWDMVKPGDPLKITLADLLACKQGGTVASMLIDVRGFWAHDNRENLLQEEEEPEEEGERERGRGANAPCCHSSSRIELNMPTTPFPTNPLIALQPNIEDNKSKTLKGRMGQFLKGSDDPKNNWQRKSGKTIQCTYLLRKAWILFGMPASVAAIVGGVGGFVALLVITILCLWFCVSHYKMFSNKNSETESSAPSAVVEMKRGRSSSSTAPPLMMGGAQEAMQFRLEDLEQATRNFDESNLIGCGSFGLVYKGILCDGTVVAIKRHIGPPMQGFSEEVKYLARIHHRHIVTLLGYFQDNGHQMLIYEYLPNGSVSNHLYGKYSTVKLEFKQRLSIAVGAARGLCHLHGQSPSLVHGNFKTANVLVDENFISKVADAGVSKLVGGTEAAGPSSPNINAFKDPEIVQTGRIFETTDVYSFGIFLLELITGKEASEMGSSEIRLQWIERHLISNDIVDRRLEGNFTAEAMRDFIRLAIRCMTIPGRLRPNMEMVSSELEEILDKEIMLTTVVGEGTDITLGSHLFTK